MKRAHCNKRSENVHVHYNKQLCKQGKDGEEIAKLYKFTKSKRWKGEMQD